MSLWKRLFGRDETQPPDVWSGFQQHESQLRTSLQRAFVDEDHKALSELADELAAALVAHDDGLSLNLSGPDPLRVGILSLPGAQAAAAALLRTAPSLAGWKFELGPPEDDLQAVCVEDDDGRSLEVPYDEVLCMILPPREGRLTVLLAWDRDFDAQGEVGHLYLAAAEQLVATLLQGSPNELHAAVLVPMSGVDAADFQPTTNLRELWRAAVGALG